MRRYLSEETVQFVVLVELFDNLRDNKWATAGARLHAKTALCAGRVRSKLASGFLGLCR